MIKFAKPTTVAIGQVEDELKKSLRKGGTAEILEWEAVRIGVGKGFLSTVIKLNLKWDDAGMPSNIVIKIPSGKVLAEILTDESAGKDEQQRKRELFEAEMVSTAHDNENIVFKLLTENEVPVPRPKFYFGPGGQEGLPRCMGVEDLSHGVMVGMLDGCTVGQCRSVLEAVAALHAWSIQNRAKWEGKLKHAKRENMEQFFKDMANRRKIGQLSSVNPQCFPEEKAEIAKKYHNPAIQVDLCKFYSVFYQLESRKNGFRNQFSVLNEHGLDLKMPLVMVHGDVHGNNIFFKANKEEQAKDDLLALLDWQGTREGSFMEDIARVTLVCLAPGLRRDNEKALLQHYYECLSSHFPGKAAPFPFDAVKKDYMLLFPYHGAMILATVPLLLGPQSPFLAKLEGEAKEEFLKKWLGNAKSILDDIVTLEEGGDLWL